MSGIGYDAAHFAAVAAREKGHFWLRSRRALLLWALRRHFPHARSFLDVGCGHAEALAFAARRAAGALLVQADARALPWREEFDVVGAFDVLLWSGRDVAARHRRRYSRRELLSKLGAAGFERALIRLGVRWTAGGSLLVVARKP